MARKAHPVMDDTGAADFSKLPHVPRAQELLDTAFGRASKASAPKTVVSEKGRMKELVRLGTAGKTIEARLNKIVHAFPPMDRLHPFYRELADVLVGVDKMKKSLGALGWAHERAGLVRREAERAVRRSQTAQEAAQARRHAYGRLSSFLGQIDGDLATLGAARETLRHTPQLTLTQPTLVVAGYPNVGKSSFLRRISRATPEVAPYPFTTKGIILGHAQAGRVIVQVMDTPGLLDRPLEERNDIERQAILALRHAADAVLFLLDPSAHCGYPLDSQLRLLAEVEKGFGSATILVIENKSDISATGERPSMSTGTGTGVDAIAKIALKAAVDAFEVRREREEREVAANDAERERLRVERDAVQARGRSPRV